MNGALFAHVLRQNALRLVIVAAALTAWGTLMPIIYSAFGVQMKQMVEQFPMLQQMMHFGGGDIFTLSGSIALGFIHPIAIALLAVFAIVFPLSSVAGERQRGTLEVVLARPVRRNSYYVTLFVAALLFVAIAMAATLVGTVIAAVGANVIDQLAVENIPALWINGLALWASIAAICFAASVSFDRLAPAAGISAAIVLVSYFLQIIGSLWPDADWLQPYSLFHYLDADKTLKSGLQTFDTGLLLLAGAAAVVYALFVFPRRDLAAPA